MISFTELLPRLVTVTKLTERDHEFECPRCGGRATIRSFGRGWSAKCPRCGNLGEDDFRDADAPTDGQGAGRSTGVRQSVPRKDGGDDSAHSSAAQPAHEEVNHIDATESVASVAAPAAGLNGAGGGRYKPDVHTWKLTIYTRARDQVEDLLHKGTADSRAAAEMVVQSTQLEDWIATVNQQRNLPQDNLTYDPALTPVEIDEEIQVLARALLDRYTPLAVRNGNGHLPAVEDVFADRHAVDAYLAYEAMKGDLREYSWEGLIREGCTGVLSGLMSSGKTTLAMNLARGWALGEQVLGRQCKQSRTLVVVSPKEFEAWADTIGFWGLKGLIFLAESTKAHFADRALTVRWLDQEMKALECRTLILDTLFDFFGMPPNTAGDSNRIAMNEQTPLLQLIRERTYSGLMLGHAPKSEAKAIDPRDPEESFGGHTAWTAQHRMRMTVRRKAQGINAFITGKGGYGDVGILKEQILLFDETSRLDSLGGLFADHLAATAMPSVVDALRELGEPTPLSKIIEAMGKGEKWVKAGLRAGRKAEPPLIEMEGGKGKRGTKYRLTEWPLEKDLF